MIDELREYIVGAILLLVTNIFTYWRTKPKQDSEIQGLEATIIKVVGDTYATTLNDLRASYDRLMNDNANLRIENDRLNQRIICLEGKINDLMYNMKGVAHIENHGD